MKLDDCGSLAELWKYAEELHRKEFPGHGLALIPGNGKTTNPKIMFIFINPTSRNISSDLEWKGPRFPFIGTKQIWRVFSKAQLFDSQLMNEIEKSDSWSLELTNKVLDFLEKKDYYFTNIVKWTGKDAALPDSKKTKLFLPILEKEIEIVKPKHIVTFGLIPFENLAKQKIQLEEYYKGAVKHKNLPAYRTKILSIKAEIIPCYFPVGRGNPKRAVELLKIVSKL